MDNDIQPQEVIQSIEPAQDQQIEQTIEPPKSPIKSFRTPLERNKYIIDRYSEGIRQADIGLEVGLSEVRIGQIVRGDKSLLIEREAEKLRRLHRLKLCESKASPKLGPKTATELVNIIKAQREELEPDSNTINIDARSVNITNMKQDSELIDSIKSINAMFAKLLADQTPKPQLEEPNS